MAPIHHDTDTGTGRASVLILGVVLVLVALALAAFVFLFGGAFRPNTSSPAQPSGDHDTNLQIKPPAPTVGVKIQPAPGGSGQSSPSGGRQAPSKP